MAVASALSVASGSRRHLFHALASAIGVAELPAPPNAMRRAGKPPVDDSLSLPHDASQVTAVPPAVPRWLSKASFAYFVNDHIAFNALPGATEDARWISWVDRQLQPSTIPDTTCDARIASAGFSTLGKTLQQLWADHHSQTSNYYLRMLPISEVECMTTIRQAYSERQLFETMADFWHDHFSVFGWDYDAGPVFVQYDRDVIRPNVFGNFRTMLEQVCRSTTMMYYLDLYSSTRAGPNENFARELFELHALGAENYGGVLWPDDPSLPLGQLADGSSVRLKYVDNDVYEATSALTGWTLKNGHWQYPAENDGTFTYRDDWHDQYQKYVLNRYFPSYQHQADGTRLFDILAAHPGTARFVAGKMCRRLVSDTPSPALIDSIAQIFQANWQAPDQLAKVTRAILLSNDYKTTWGAKLKRPAVAAIGALRALQSDFIPKPDNTASWTTTEEFMSRLQQTGNRLFYWPAPNGYPDRQVAWASSGALAMTFRMLCRITEMRHNNDVGTSPLIADVVWQTTAVFPALADRTANTIVGYWCDRLFGHRPEPVMTVAVNFLRQNALATDPLDLATEAWNGPDLKRHYTQSRLRTTIALMLCSPDFLRR